MSAGRAVAAAVAMIPSPVRAATATKRPVKTMGPEPVQGEAEAWVWAEGWGRDTEEVREAEGAKGWAPGMRATTRLTATDRASPKEGG